MPSWYLSPMTPETMSLDLDCVGQMWISKSWLSLQKFCGGDDRAIKERIPHGDDNAEFP